jgi:hypothetical protein
LSQISPRFTKSLSSWSHPDHPETGDSIGNPTNQRLDEPSLGRASVRIQGMSGRYTRFLADGLPPFGQEVDGLGLLEIPPMDLGHGRVFNGGVQLRF